MPNSKMRHAKQPPVDAAKMLVVVVEAENHDQLKHLKHSRLNQRPNQPKSVPPALPVRQERRHPSGKNACHNNLKRNASNAPLRPNARSVEITTTMTAQRLKASATTCPGF